jgi:hypothetical protein
MAEPITGKLIVDDGIAGAGWKFQNEKQTQAGTCQNGDNGIRENSLHPCHASYNKGESFHPTTEIQALMEDPSRTSG